MQKLKKLIVEYQNLVLFLLLVAVLLLQILLRVDVANEKAYLHIDEGYSYGLMNYSKVDIIANDGIYERWHDSAYYQDYLSISSEEAFNLKPVYENQKNDVHPPFYYLLLRIASSFTLDIFSKWTGIILNIIIFVLSSIMIYFISNKLFKNKLYAIFIVLVNGFTLASIETTIFIRMYALNTLNLLIITYLHMKNYHREILGIQELVLMSICIIIGSLTHYYYLVFFFILFMIYIIKFIKIKNIKNLIRYIGMMIVSAAISLAIFPYSFVHIFMGYRGTQAISDLEKVEQIWNSLGRYLAILNNNVFNGILIFLLILGFGIVIYKIMRNKKITIKFQNKEQWIMLLPTIFYFLIVAVVSPYQEIRYIMPICPFIVIGIFYLLKILLEKVISTNKTFVVLNMIFIIMLFFPRIMGLKVRYVYKDYQHVINEIETNHDIPVLYIININHNRIMDDIYLFSKIDHSYIIDAKHFNKEKIKEILENIDLSKGIFIMINERLENDPYLEMLKQELSYSELKYMQKLNETNIYRLEK